MTEVTSAHVRFLWMGPGLIVFRMKTSVPIEQFELLEIGNETTGFVGLNTDFSEFLDSSLPTRTCQDTGRNYVLDSTGSYYFWTYATDRMKGKTNELKLSFGCYGKTENLASVSVAVKDPSPYERDWIERKALEFSGSLQSDGEKMEAFTKYVSTEFSYYMSDTYGKRSLFVESNPYWVSKRIDCIDAAEILKKMAEAVGIEAEVVYAGYANHHVCAAMISEDQVWKDYDATPEKNGIFANVM